MPVMLRQGGKVTRTIRRNRRDGYNRKVRDFAPLLISLQSKGYISANAIAEILRQTSVRTARGNFYAESVIFNMLRRAHELGFPIIRRTRF